MAVPKWQTFSPSDLYPQEVVDLLTELEDVANTLGTALTVLTKAVQVLGDLVSEVTDVYQAVVESIQAAIDSVVQQLTQTGIYSLFYMPTSRVAKLPPASWVSGIATSLDDYSDTERPVLVDPSAYVSMIVVCVTSSTYSDLLSDYRSFFDMLKRNIASALQVSRWQDESSFRYVDGVGKEPNWKSIRVGDVIPAIGDLGRIIDAFGRTITTAIAPSNVYSQFADLLGDKAAYLLGIAQVIEDTLEELNALLNIEGAFVLQIYGQGDAEWLQNNLLNARGGPFDVENAEFTAGAAFLATGGTTAQVELLTQLFGLTAETTEFSDG